VIEKPALRTSHHDGGNLSTIIIIIVNTGVLYVRLKSCTVWHVEAWQLVSWLQVNISLMIYLVASGVMVQHSTYVF